MHAIKAETLYEQGTGTINEDAVVISGNLFGVFDGATSLDKTTFEKGATGGYLASATAREIFRSNNGSLLDLASKANTAIQKKMVAKGVNVARKENRWSTCAAVGRIENDTFHWVQSGDSLILVIYDDGSHALLVQDWDHDAETLKMWKETESQRSGSILDEMKEQIRKVRAGMNVHYGVINGEEKALEFLRHGSVQLKGVTHILMFTDGLFIPREDPVPPAEFKQLVSLFLTSGLQGIRNAIRAMEKDDPECRKYPRFKTHDDIAAIALSL